METPDRWCVISIPQENNNISYKVFGSWCGGYLGGDYWQMNSGVVDVTEDDTHFYFHGESGSIYQCHKETYGATSYGSSVLNGFIKNAEKHGYNIKILESNFNFISLKND